ncbi:hypothetical protein K353_00055 [Kitasatospora sp. SolWspMP-SS2h]|uniref:hypothetical protein n=1 Tax=Kitasatospora sp. SolWspMP-SS2h TaxID=1305729 RepID=UPI000DBA5F9D|nr:hypothetical protein [Kitasatospora sp. SolWspMP-SS2h]RAJ46854.1 hypothetical protein K353_00055 [Kitasatospora sp. SolWspMP-SS2h]
MPEPVTDSAAVAVAVADSVVDAPVWPYLRTEVFAGLADARERDGGAVHFGVRGTGVPDVAIARPRVRFTAAADATRHGPRRRPGGLDGGVGTRAGHAYSADHAYPAGHAYPAEQETGRPAAGA